MWAIYFLESLLERKYVTPKATDQGAPASHEVQSVPLSPPGQLVLSSIFMLFIAYVTIKIVQWAWSFIPLQNIDVTPTDVSPNVNRLPDQHFEPPAQISQPVREVDATKTPSTQTEVQTKAESPPVSATNEGSILNQAQSSQWDYAPVPWEEFEQEATNLHIECMRIREKLLTMFDARTVQGQSETFDSDGKTITERIREKVVITSRDPYHLISRRRLEVKFLHIFWCKYVEICDQGQKMYEAHQNGSRDYGTSHAILENLKGEIRILQQAIRGFETPRIRKNPKGRRSRAPKPLAWRKSKNKKKVGNQGSPVTGRPDAENLSSSDVVDIGPAPAHSENGDASLEQSQHPSQTTHVSSTSSTHHQGKRSQLGGQVDPQSALADRPEARPVVATIGAPDSVDQVQILDAATKAAIAKDVRDQIARLTANMKARKKATQVMPTIEPSTDSTGNIAPRAPTSESPDLVVDGQATGSVRTRRANDSTRVIDVDKGWIITKSSTRSTQTGTNDESVIPRIQRSSRGTQTDEKLSPSSELSQARSRLEVDKYRTTYPRPTKYIARPPSGHGAFCTLTYRSRSSQITSATQKTPISTNESTSKAALPPLHVPAPGSGSPPPSTSEFTPATLLAHQFETLQITSPSSNSPILRSSQPQSPGPLTLSSSDVPVVKFPPPQPAFSSIPPSSDIPIVRFPPPQVVGTPPRPDLSENVNTKKSIAPLQVEAQTKPEIGEESEKQLQQEQARVQMPNVPLTQTQSGAQVPMNVGTQMQIRSPAPQPAPGRPAAAFKKPDLERSKWAH